MDTDDTRAEIARWDELERDPKKRELFRLIYELESAVQSNTGMQDRDKIAFDLHIRQMLETVRMMPPRSYHIASADTD